MESALVIGAKDSNDPAFMAALTALANEPIDGPVAVSRLAQAMLIERQGDDEAASQLMTSTLDAWREVSVLPQSTDAPLDRDIAAILEVSTDYVTSRAIRDSYGKPPQDRPAGSRRIVFDSVQLRLPGTPASSPRRLALLPPAWTNVVITSRREFPLLARAVDAIAGRMPAANMTAFWVRHFPTPSNNWRGWNIETYPLVREIEFLDAPHTSAAARVNVDAGSGFTAILEKRGESWVVIRITNQWIS
jgi:hypothetical protein